MTNLKTCWDSLHPWMKCVLGVFVLLIIGNAVSRQAGADGWDFHAYYTAGRLVLAGGHPYVIINDYPYKYGPASVAPFLFFQLFNYEVARWVYCVLHILVALSIPLLNFKLLSTSRHLALQGKTYFWAIAIGFAGSLRFLDGEFQTSQISLWIYAATIVAVLLLVNHRKPLRLVGVATLAMVSEMKIHSSVMWIALSKTLFTKKNLLMFWPLVLIFLLPNPAWWLEWARQIKETTPLLPSDLSAINRQGFFGVAVLMLHWEEYGVGPWVLSLPFFVYALLRLPRFSIGDLWACKNHHGSNGAIGVALTMLSWMLWGFMSSPLPWQHTYSLLWGLIPLLWMVSTPQQQRLIAGLSVMLALTPKGIIGPAASRIFEANQGPFILILILWFTMIEQARNNSRLAD